MRKVKTGEEKEEKEIKCEAYAVVVSLRRCGYQTFIVLTNDLYVLVPT